MIKSIKDLKVYEIAYKLAMEVFEMTKKFPKEETYSLTDQIRRSSRSAAINIREGYAKRKYEQVFARHLNDSLGSSEETRGWLDFAEDCKYITEGVHKKLDDGYDEVNAMLYTLMNNWQSSEDRGQRTEDRRQMTEVRRQKSGKSDFRLLTSDL